MTTAEDLRSLAEPQDGDDDLVKQLRGTLKSKLVDHDELETAKRELAELKREKAVRDAGLELKPAQVTGLLAAHGDKELKPEELFATAAELGFAEAKETDVPDDALTTEERIEAAGKGADGGKPASLTAADVATWSMDKRLAFMKEHPQAWEALKRGEPVTGIAAA